MYMFCNSHDYKLQVNKMCTIKSYFRSYIATIKGTSTTTSTSIGDSVSLDVTTNLAVTVLRWRHNGEYVGAWDGMKSVTITNVRKADEGIYECYEDGHREDGVHDIMRLIVRGKLSSKERQIYLKYSITIMKLSIIICIFLIEG